jgi:hypothetical protein
MDDIALLIPQPASLSLLYKSALMVAITTSHLRSITHLRMVLNICQVLGVSAGNSPFYIFDIAK